MDGNGYAEEGFEEWAEEELKKDPPWLEIIVMEDDLGIPNKGIRVTERDKAWAYYYELKALLEEKQRKTA